MLECKGAHSAQRHQHIGANTIYISGIEYEKAGCWLPYLPEIASPPYSDMTMSSHTKWEAHSDARRSARRTHIFMGDNWHKCKRGTISYVWRRCACFVMAGWFGVFGSNHPALMVNKTNSFVEPLPVCAHTLYVCGFLRYSWLVN